MDDRQKCTVAVMTLRDKWMKIFHELASNHFGDHTAEAIANTYLQCAIDLERVFKDNEKEDQ